MTTFEDFYYKNLKIAREKIPNKRMLSINPQKIISTRAFLEEDRYKGIVRRSSKLYSQIILIDGNYYCIDGHHKIKRAIDEGKSVIECEVVEDTDPQLKDILQKRGHGLINNLKIRSQI